MKGKRRTRSLWTHEIVYEVRYLGLNRRLRHYERARQTRSFHSQPCGGQLGFSLWSCRLYIQTLYISFRVLVPYQHLAHYHARSAVFLYKPHSSLEFILDSHRQPITRARSPRLGSCSKSIPRKSSSSSSSSSLSHSSSWSCCASWRNLSRPIPRTGPTCWLP